ncbi:MAG: hypothetical protein N2235_05385 [Fischerella sp.]|nr:hypothetical protein [Fischerella sp.]
MSIREQQQQVRRQIDSILTTFSKEHGYKETTKDWWFNFLPWSLRLSNCGFVFLSKHLDVKNYKFDLIKNLKNYSLVQLESKLICPYYVESAKKLHLFGEKESVMLMLHSENLENYLNTL